MSKSVKHTLSSLNESILDVVSKQQDVYESYQLERTGLKQESVDTDETETLEEDFGATVMAVIVGNFLYELLGILLLIVTAGGVVGFRAIKAAWEARKELARNKKLEIELLQFVKGSKTIREVKKKHEQFTALRDNMKADLKGMRGDARKEKEAEIEKQIKTLQDDWRRAKTKLADEIEEAGLSREALKFLEKLGLDGVLAGGMKSSSGKRF